MERENQIADSSAHYSSRYPQNKFEEFADIALILLFLRRNAWLISFCVLTAFILALIYVFKTTPTYMASSTILIEPQKANVVSFEEYFGVDSEHDDYHQTQFEILKSRKLAERVIDRLQLWDHPEFSELALFQLGSNDTLYDTVKSKPLLYIPSSLIDKLIHSDFYIDTSKKFKTILHRDDLSPSNGEYDQNVSSLSIDQHQELINTTESQSSQVSDELNRILVIDNFTDRLRLTSVRRTKLVTISYESESAELARDITNAVGEEYINSYKDSKLASYERTSQWLTERLKTLKSTLDLSESKLIAYKKLNGLVDVGGSVGRLNEQGILALTNELSQARSALSKKTGVLRTIDAANNNVNILKGIPNIQSNNVVQQIQLDQGNAIRKRDELSNRYGKLHPKIIDIQSDIQSLNSNLAKHVLQITGSIREEHALLTQAVANLNEKLETAKQEIQLIGSQKMELDALEREVATNQKIYDTYFSRMTEANSTNGLETSNAEIVDKASLAVVPYRPKKVLVVTLAALAAFFVSAAISLVREILDRSVKGSKDVENNLNSRMLGILPYVKSGFFSKKLKSPLHPMDIVGRGREFVEAVNTTKTAITIQDQQKYQQIILITSSIPGEGKSTISTNLAAALGKLERVLLIDCDLRRPSLAKCLGINRNATGLSNLISGTAVAEECLHREVIRGVDLIPSGQIPEDPLEYLTSARFKSILQELSIYYDRILLDCAPTSAVSDALILSTLCDSVIYIVKAHDTSTEVAKSGLTRLLEVEAPLAGVILSQVKTERMSKHDGEQHIQGYFDLYGYTNPSNSDNNRSKNLTLTPSAVRRMNSTEPAGLELSKILEPAFPHPSGTNELKSDFDKNQTKPNVSFANEFYDSENYPDLVGSKSNSQTSGRTLAKKNRQKMERFSK